MKRKREGEMDRKRTDLYKDRWIGLKNRASEDESRVREKEKLGFLLLPVMEMKMESLRVESEVPAFSSLCFRRADASDNEMLKMVDSWGFCTQFS